MDFAPYQSSPPEHGRAFSPPQDGSSSPRTSWDARRSFSPPQQQQYKYGYQARSPPPLQHPQPQRGWSASSVSDGVASPPPPAAGGSAGDYFGAREGMVSEFDTSLGIRLDYEACLAYLAVPPLGAILLLIMERKSDYVRFHAWQSSLLFTAVFIIHLIFSFSPLLSWFIFIGDLGLIAWLTLRAYRDADTLDRYEVPLVGRIASRIVDDE